MRPPELGPGKCCEHCEHFDGKYRCTLYDYTVDSHEWCRSFEFSRKAKVTQTLRKAA